jgi:ribosomal protein S27AE
MSTPAERPLPQPESEPVCLLHRVCPECGRVAEHDPPTRCAECGAAIVDD